MISDVKSRWWWPLPPDRLRVALVVYEMLTRSNPATVDFHILSTELATSRGTVLRTLGDLERARLIHIKTTAGRLGSTEVILRDRRWFCDPEPEQFNDDQTAQNHNETQTAPERAGQISGQLRTPVIQPSLDLLKPTKNSDPDPSSDSPGRSYSPEIQRNETVPTNVPTMTPPTDPQSTGPSAKRRPRIDPVKIPRDAWRAADGLRARILKYNPGNRLATRKWAGEAGDRLSWAHTFDLMVRVDKRGWLDISGVMLWLWPDDASKGPSAAARMFVIESAESLREKFDRVVAARQREHTETPGRTPDTRQAPTFKTWGDQ